MCVRLCNVLVNVCAQCRSSPRRSSAGHGGVESAAAERYDRYERDEPDLYGEQFAPYPTHPR